MAFPAGWTKYREVAVNAAKVGDGGVTDFQVLVTGANFPAAFWSACLEDGADLRFSIDGLTELSHELVSFNPAEQTMQVWVKVPSLSDVTNTIIRCYYGNAAATVPSAESQQATWADGYEGVFHLDEQNSGAATGAAVFRESVSGNVTGLDYISDTNKLGKIGAGQKFDGAGDYMAAAGSDSITNKLSVSLWMNYANVANWQPIISGSRTGSFSDAWSLLVAEGAEFRFYVNGTYVLAGCSPFTAGTWHHLMMTYDDGVQRFYVDGSANVAGPSFGPPVSGDITNLNGLSAGRTGLPWWYNGYLDELRVSSVVRAANWASTEYANQSDPSTFYEVGDEVVIFEEDDLEPDPLLNVTSILDAALAAMRVKVDPTDWRSAGPLFESVRAEMYGFSERSSATKGVIFGLDTCYFADIGASWNLFGPPPVEDPLLGGPDGNSLVITRGNLYDGTKVVSIEPIEGKAYAYLVTLPDLGGSNCLASGGLFWDIANSTFKLVIRGSETAGRPPILLDKSYCTLERFVASAFGNNPLDSALWPLEDAGLIRLARVVIDVSEAGDQSAYFIVDKEPYPMPPGQPSPYLMEFGHNLSDGIKNCMKSYYDTTLVSTLMETFTSAAIWGGFRTYWSSGGRVCPPNAKYYYNRLYDPDIT